MDKLEFVDTHVHLYDMQHPELVYGHWQPSEPHPVIGWQIRKLAEKNYVAEDYIAETRNANVTKAVHVQAAFGNPDPVTETEWLQEAADRTDFPHGIVAHADLRDPGVERVLERHCESPNMRGIRDFSYGDYLVEPDYHRGFALLEKYNLVSSMPVEWQHMEKLRALANKFPNILIVVDHTAFPTERTDEYFENWKKRRSHRGHLRQHPLEDLRPRHGRPQLDDRQHQAVRPHIHRNHGRGPLLLRHQLAGRLAIQHLRRSHRRLH